MDGYAEGGISGDVDNTAAGFRWVYRMFANRAAPPAPTHHSTEGQIVPRLRIPEAMDDEPSSGAARASAARSIESQFKLYKYPASGYSPIGMYYQYGGSFFGTMTESNRYVKAYRERQVPFVVNQIVWIEGETKFADIILPACTNLERWDIGEWANCSGYVPDNFTPVQPPGDRAASRSASSRWASASPTTRSSPSWPSAWASRASSPTAARRVWTGSSSPFAATDLPKHITWEEFEKKGYFVVPFARGPRVHPGLPLVRRGPGARHPRLGPASRGHVQAQGSADPVRQDRVRLIQPHPLREDRRSTPSVPIMGPQYLESWEGHHTTGLVRQVPAADDLARTRASASTPWATAKGSWLNDVKDHRVLHDDGHYYWIMRVNTEDAAARGIADGDLIRAFNDRGSVILAAQVTERVPSGHGALLRELRRLPADRARRASRPTRAGCVNILTSKRYITPTSTAMAPNSCLVQVEKWEGEAR